MQSACSNASATGDAVRNDGSVHFWAVAHVEMEAAQAMAS